MFRDWFADNLGVGQARKEQVYLEICSSLSLDDASYWIQVLFSDALTAEFVIELSGGYFLCCVTGDITAI